MRKSNYHGRCTKRSLPKFEGICRTYDRLQEAEADILVANEEVEIIRCNVPFEDEKYGGYTSDFVCTKTNGELMVRECVWRKHLTKPKTVEQMDFSQLYWRKRGVYDWKVVVEKERPDNEKEA